MSNKIAEVNAIRSRLGCGLREALDAYTQYGSSAAAIKALLPDVPAVDRDPYALAVADRERWAEKSSTYQAALQRIANIALDPHIKELAEAGLREGRNI